MEIKRDIDVCTSDFWYDLTDGGYLKPFEICANEEDAKRVQDAIDVLQEFQRSCNEQVEDFTV